MSTPVCEVCLKQVYKLNLKYETVYSNVCMPCLANHFHVCEIDEVAVRKEDLQELIYMIRRLEYDIQDGQSIKEFENKYLGEKSG